MRDASEGHLEVVRTARYWVLGEEVASPAEVWFVLHGYRQLARRFLNRFASLADGTRRIVAPEALSRFYVEDSVRRHGPGSVVGATWMTREDREHEIADYVRYLDALADRVLAGVAGAPRVVVVGFSQGVATACRWTVLGRLTPHTLALWGDFLPPDLPLERASARWRGVDVLLVRGDGDPAMASGELSRAEEERLASAGLALRLVGYDGGHDIHEPTLRELSPGGA